MEHPNNCLLYFSFLKHHQYNTKVNLDIHHNSLQKLYQSTLCQANSFPIVFFYTNLLYFFLRNTLQRNKILKIMFWILDTIY